MKTIVNAYVFYVNFFYFLLLILLASGLHLKISFNYFSFFKSSQVNLTKNYES